MKFLDHLTFRQADGKTCRAWFAHDLGDSQIIFIDRGPGNVSVEVARAGVDGIYQREPNYPLNQEGQKALAEEEEFVAEALKPEEPK